MREIGKQTQSILWWFGAHIPTFTIQDASSWVLLSPYPWQWVLNLTIDFAGILTLTIARSCYYWHPFYKEEVVTEVSYQKVSYNELNNGELDKNTRVKVYTPNRMDWNNGLNEYEELLGLSRCLYVKVLLLARVMEHIYVMERVRENLTRLNVPGIIWRYTWDCPMELLEGPMI